MTVAAFLGVLVAPVSASAAAGTDAFGSAPTLAFSAPGAVNNTGFAHAGEPLCPAMTGTAWWRIAGTGQQITLTTAGSSPDTILAVYNHGTTPTNANRITCNDNEAVGIQTSRLQFNSLRGNSYLVQVGGSNGDIGLLKVSASAPRPPNDDRGKARVLQTGIPVTVSNAGASHEPGEMLTCSGDPYAATIWFRWSAPTIGTAVFSSSAAFFGVANPSNTVLAVRRASDGALVGCNDDASHPAGPSALAATVAPGDYLLQVGAFGTEGITTIGEGGITASVDFTPDLDLDRDASLRPKDCNDADPLINPGAADVPGDGVDQDCLGGDAPYPLLASTVTFNYLSPLVRSGTPYVRITELVIKRAVAGSRVKVSCRGRGCPPKRKVIKVKTSSKRRSVLGTLKKARLKRGVVFEVRITKKGHVGYMRRFKVRGTKKNPKVRAKEYCLPFPKGKPKSC